MATSDKSQEDKNKEAGLIMFGSDKVGFKKYESLQPKNDYDHEKAETLAEAMTELTSINKRKKFLESLLNENKDLKPYLWSSLDGRVQALHAIEPTHFENILKHLASRGATISKAIRAEAAVRGIDVPESYTAEEDYFDDDDAEVFTYSKYINNISKFLDNKKYPF